MEFREWHKSTRSGNSAQCVEVSDDVPGVVGVRDSKDPTGPVLVFERAAFRHFLSAVKRGELDI